MEDTTTQIKLRNGFPSTESTWSPLEVLLRRVRAPTEGRADVYFADENLEPGQSLPDSDLLKAIHAYVSDFYSSRGEDRGMFDFRSLDETALIALGLLLEEAALQVLGETGDMVLVEPEGLEDYLPESRATQMQVNGRVPQVQTPPYASEDEESSEEPDDDEMRKRRRR
jgi:UAF complex subunit Rrn10